MSAMRLYKEAMHQRLISKSIFRGIQPIINLRAFGSQPSDLGPDDLEAHAHEFNLELDSLFGTTLASESDTAARPTQQLVPPATQSLAQQPTFASSNSIPSKFNIDQGSKLTHIDATGRASMVDVGEKPSTKRTATAGVRILLGPHVFPLVSQNKLQKGDVLTVAQLAGIMGAKQTSNLIPLCHPLFLSSVNVDLRLNAEECALDVTTTAVAVGQTGVEMEALTAAAVAALTVYDMCKAASKGIEITNLRLLSKSGGKSGDYSRD